jgi:hypothetical protein
MTTRSYLINAITGQLALPQGCCAMYLIDNVQLLRLGRQLLLWIFF